MSESQAAPADPVKAAGPNLPGGGQEGNNQRLRAIVIGPVLKADQTTGATKELPPDDLLTSLSNDGKILTAPFDKLVLAMLPEQSTSLMPLIDAMRVNIDGFGHRFESRIKTDSKEVPDKLLKEVAKERAMLVNFFNNCCQEHSFVELRMRTRVDIESTGEGFWEIIRLPSSGKIVGFNHIPSYQISLGIQNPDLTRYDRVVPTINEDGEVTLENLTSMKRFRPFVQSRINVWTRSFGLGRTGYELRWFKEWGDPRIMDNRTGEIITDEAKIKALPEEHRASELIHWKLYNPRTPYGMPRYIGNLITLYGDRAADEVNYVTLRNNNIPSMIIMVSNGQLTQASVDRIQDFVQSQIHGSDNFSRFLLIEAEGQFEGPETHNIKLDIKPLTSEQMRDQLFQEYGKNNHDKLRENFRIPPIFVGRAEDYTRATAESSRRLADEQVFSPPRDEFDNLMNQRLLPELGARFHTFVSNSPNVTDDADLIAVLSDAEATGGMTPRLARQVIADILSIDEHLLPPLDPSINPDIPFTLQVAEAVKNEAEPQHQLAVKSAAGPSIRTLLKFRQEMEEAFMEVRRARREARASRAGA